MDFNFVLLIVIVVLAFGFDLINGFHDAANSIATVVSTKVLTPFQAVLWAAFFNFVAYLVFNLHVADTIAKTVDTSAITLGVILSGLIISDKKGMANPLGCQQASKTLDYLRSMPSRLAAGPPISTYQKIPLPNRSFSIFSDKKNHT